MPSGGFFPSAPALNQTDHRVAIAPGIGVHGWLLREVGHDHDHVLADRGVAVTQVEDREVPVVGTVPPREKEIRNAGGLAGVAVGDADQALDRGTDVVEPDGADCGTC